MKRLTLEEKYNIIKKVCTDDYCDKDGRIFSVGIHNFGLLHDIADALGMKSNTGHKLRSLSARIAKIMRDLIEAGYPIKEYRIKCCSWSPKETWHPVFEFEVEQ